MKRLRLVAVVCIGMGISFLSPASADSARGAAAERVVQARGTTCRTDSGQCPLSSPAALNSSCCCPSGECGKVVGEVYPRVLPTFRGGPPPKDTSPKKQRK
jgi:hypothetical protein